MCWTIQILEKAVRAIVSNKFAGAAFPFSRRSDFFRLICCFLSVKKFSEWPTIPQLYVNGEFIGGCDIVTQMHESGELKDVLAEAKEDK